MHPLALRFMDALATHRDWPCAEDTWPFSMNIAGVDQNNMDLHIRYKSTHIGVGLMVKI